MVVNQMMVTTQAMPGSMGWKCTCGATGGRRYKYITIIELGRELPHNIGMCNGENLLVI